MGLSPVLKIFYHIAALFSTKREGEITEKRKILCWGGKSFIIEIPLRYGKGCLLKYLG